MANLIWVGVPPKPEVSVVTVVAGRFAALVDRGLLGVLGDDRRICVLDSGVEDCYLSRAIADLTPEVLILDEQSLHQASRWSRATLSTGVLVVARQPKDSYGMVLLAAGITCVADNATMEDILASVHVAAQGGCTFVSARGSRTERVDREPWALLTNRELQVLERLSENETYGTIARDLGISVLTVQKHTTALRRKLGATSKHELVGVPIFG